MGAIITSDDEAVFRTFAEYIGATYPELTLLRDTGRRVLAVSDVPSELEAYLGGLGAAIHPDTELDMAAPPPAEGVTKQHLDLMIWDALPSLDYAHFTAEEYPDEDPALLEEVADLIHRALDLYRDEATGETILAFTRPGTPETARYRLIAQRIEA